MTEPMLTPERRDRLRRMKCPGLTEDEFALFVDMIERYRLDPFLGQIHVVTRNVNVGTKTNPKWEKKATVQTGIDGYRLIADRTGHYAGNDDPVFVGTTTDNYPAAATVVVWKMIGTQRCAFSATARWTEYTAGTAMWQRMPHVMLGKCAEALALRKAFPAELAGLYTDEEMEQADAPPPAEPPPPRPTDPPPVNDAALEDTTKTVILSASVETLDKTIASVFARADIGPHRRLDVIRAVILAENLALPHIGELRKRLADTAYDAETLGPIYNLIDERQRLLSTPATADTAPGF